MKFVADAADIVLGAKFFMWSNFAQHDTFCLSCGSKLLHITIVHHMTQLFEELTYLINVVPRKTLKERVADFFTFPKYVNGVLETTFCSQISFGLAG